MLSRMRRNMGTAMALPTIYACSVAVAVLLGLIVLRLKSLAAE